MQIHQDQFLGSKANVCVTYSINASFSIIITNFQQKYVVLTAIRRSGGISKILLIEKLKSKVYFSNKTICSIEDLFFKGPSINYVASVLGQKLMILLVKRQ